MAVPEMVWVDMETTGLDEKYDVPLEIGIMTTDRYGHEIARGDWLIGLPEWRDRIEDAKTHEVVGDMHTKSGLWFDWEQAILNKPEEITPRAVQDSIMFWLDEHHVAYQKYPLSGSSLRLDRSFMITYLPDIDLHFHYRIIDNSSTKELCKIHNPKVYSKLPEAQNKSHRVIADIRDSITEYQFYLDNFLWVDA